MWRYIFNYLSLIFPTSRFFWLKSKILRLANVQIGQNVSVCSQCWIYGHGKIKIGSETWLSQGVKFLTHNDAQITIGKFCDIGPFVKFLTGGHEISSHKRRAGLGFAKPIKVDDGCWIGASTIILHGVHIGAGSVIAAGSVVVHDVPKNTLFAGVPAKFVRNL
jgi:maltose O-acetyltransferase